MLHLLLFRMMQKSMPALAGIRVMLLISWHVIVILSAPALAGIRVMLRLNRIIDYVTKEACISRYSCNVTQPTVNPG